MDMTDAQRAAARKALRGVQFSIERQGDATIITPEGKPPVTVINGASAPGQISRDISQSLRS